MGWFFRTKPRNMWKVVEWFKYFSDLEGMNFEDKSTLNSRFKDKPIHPVRRQYIYTKKYDELVDKFTYHEFLSGQFDLTEVESDARNDKKTYEFFGLGYVDKNGIIKNTKSGNLLKNGYFTEDHLLKILCKMEFNSSTSNCGLYKTSDGLGATNVFPFEIILKAMKRFETLSQFELGFLFNVSKMDEVDHYFNEIVKFRTEVKKIIIENGAVKSSGIVSRLCDEMLKTASPNLSNKPETYYVDYSDALMRTLQYTGIFRLSGRGVNRSIKVAEYAKSQFDSLLETIEFESKSFGTSDEWIEYIGDYENIVLPWENIQVLDELVQEKIRLFNSLLETYVSDYPTIDFTAFRLKTFDIDDVTVMNAYVTEKIIELNEKIYIDVLSKEADERSNIIEILNDINNEKIENPALWLENITWKSLVSIDGAHYVKRNFKVEEDLTPRSFAPGYDNTPDMELYYDRYIVIPEVSLMSGVRQWEHEGSSVVDHVSKFIKNNSNKETVGLFITKSINTRSLWQFFILAKESWLGYEIPIIPVTIKQYTKLLEYSQSSNIESFIEVLFDLARSAKIMNNHNEWMNLIIEKINNL